MEILIVESSLQIIERLEVILSETKNITAIHRASSFEEASKNFASAKPDVVLLDVGLPENKSVDLLKEIKAIKRKPAVIVLSSQTDMLTKKKYLSVGADFFFDKYHEFEKITGVLNNISENLKRKPN